MLSALRSNDKRNDFGGENISSENGSRFLAAGFIIIKLYFIIVIVVHRDH